jgi:hypothetical protein
MLGRFECAAIFLVRRQNAIGWRVLGPGLAPEEIESLAIPLGGASVLQSAHDSGHLFRGKADTPGHPVERKLWGALAIDHEPEDILVVPVSLGSRVVNLIYGHAFEGESIDGKVVQEMTDLADSAEQAYVRLIAEARKDA